MSTPIRKGVRFHIVEEEEEEAMAARKMRSKTNELRRDPDRCYKEESKKGRYENLKEILPNTQPGVKEPNHVRFVCISDTHGRTDELLSVIPDGDILLHAGDFTESSGEEEIVHFNDFLGKVKERFEHIVVIAGNHDISFDKTWNDGILDSSLFGVFYGSNSSQEVNACEAKKLLTNCTYIEDETITLHGINIYGSPWQPVFENLAFNKPRGDDILEVWKRIPEGTDILMTHGPPLGIGDLTVSGNRVGCADLMSVVLGDGGQRPRYHVFGHIHEGYGMWEIDDTTFINASICNFEGKPVNKPVVFDYKLTGQ